MTAGNFSAGTFIYVDAFGRANLGNIGAGTDAAVTTRGGTLTVGNVTAGDDIWLSLFGADPTRVLTAGNLVTTGLGADDAAGPPELFGAFPNGAGPVGNVARLRSSGNSATSVVRLSPWMSRTPADPGATDSIKPRGCRAAASLPPQASRTTRPGSPASPRGSPAPSGSRGGFASAATARALAFFTG